ncbi:hypothetical protein [Dietzia sp. ANT_WB102]|uniref:hypothetical protein n=1 Tax=Dietzia sp. ANT_WB102 TaxID=2597345 RepID=UPI00165EBC37|nr:hypothetical protein [Dietzia sp. ANT_WB102]
MFCPGKINFAGNAILAKRRLLMLVHLDTGVAEVCIESCGRFIDQVSTASRLNVSHMQSSGAGSFATARQIGTVYSLFAGEDLRTLLNGFVDQARAMSALFAAAGGLIEAQDEALAGALAKAAAEPAGLQSLGLIRAGESEVFALDDRCVMGAYGRVGPEDVSDSPLEYIAKCAEGLQPAQFGEIEARASAVSEALESAAAQLQADLGNVLGSGWQGEFASSAQDSVRGLVTSAVALSGELGKVAVKARRAHDGFVTTRTNIAEQAVQAKIARSSGQMQGPVAPSTLAQSRARVEAAEQQARAIVNTEYSPAVMDANLDDLDFTAAYRVVSTSALGGPGGVDMARIWNTEGIPRPAEAAAPNQSAIAAPAGGATGPEVGGVSAAGGVGGVGAGAAVSSPGVAADAATEQALLTARAASPEGAGAVGASQGPGAAGAAGTGAGGGVNAATTAAGAPLAPVPGTHGQQGPGRSVGMAGLRGIRGAAAGDSSRRDRGFGSTAGLVGGGGAAAAGAGASRMGGAGTLAGIGAGRVATPGVGGPVAGVPGAGSVAGGPSAGAVSSSTGAAQAGRAGGMPMGGMMGGAGAGQNNDRRGHTPASYLTNATNTTAIIGDPVKVAPAVLGRAPTEDPAAAAQDQPEPSRGRVLGRNYTGRGAG